MKNQQPMPSQWAVGGTSNAGRDRNAVLNISLAIQISAGNIIVINI